MTEAIRARLELLAQNNDGRLLPDDVIEDARQEDSPLHPLFTWDLKTAAYQHWLDQARSIITSVQVMHKTSKVSVRGVYYIHDPAAGHHEQGYVSIPTVLSDDSLVRRSVLADFDQVEGRLNRARKLAALLDETGDIDWLISEVRRVREAFRTRGRKPLRRRAANSDVATTDAAWVR